MLVHRGVHMCIYKCAETISMCMKTCACTNVLLHKRMYVAGCTNVHIQYTVACTRVHVHVFRAQRCACTIACRYVHVQNRCTHACASTEFQVLMGMHTHVIVHMGMCKYARTNVRVQTCLYKCACTNVLCTCACTHGVVQM